MLRRNSFTFFVFFISFCFPLYFFSGSCLYGKGFLEKSVLPMIDDTYRGFFNFKGYYGTKQYEEIQSAVEAKERAVRVVTYNMLSQAFQETLDKNIYKVGLPGISAILECMQPDIIAVQRLPRGTPFNGFLDNLKMFRVNYGYYGTFRGSRLKGFTGVFYNEDRFTLVESFKERIGGLNNPTIWVKLRDKRNKEVEFFVVSFELTLSNADVRAIEIETLVEEVKSLKIPVILMGEFNLLPSFPNEVESFHWLDGSYCSRILLSSLEDAYDVALLGHYGYSSNRLMPSSPYHPFLRTDRIYVSKSKNVKVIAHGIESATYEGFYPTERLPVFADILMEPKKRSWIW